MPQPDGDYQPIDTAANNMDSMCKAGIKLNSLTTRTPSSVYSMRARVSVASSAMTDLGFFDSMIMFWVYNRIIVFNCTEAWAPICIYLHVSGQNKSVQLKPIDTLFDTLYRLVLWMTDWELFPR